MSPKCSFLLLFLGVVVLSTPSIAQNDPKPPSEEYEPPAEASIMEEEVLENTHKFSHKPIEPIEAPSPSPKHHHHPHHKPPTGAPSPLPRYHIPPHEKPPSEEPKMEEGALDDNLVVKRKCPPKHEPPTAVPAPSPKHHHYPHHKPPTGAPSPLPKHHSHHHHHRKVSPSPAPSEDLEQPTIDWQ